MDDALFEVESLYVEAPVSEPKTTGERRRERQLEAAAGGYHPLYASLGLKLRLHEDAAPADDRKAPGLRCGTCWYRAVLPYRRRSYPKCLNPGSWGADEVEKLGYPRVTHGPGTDVAAWWPACVDYSPGDTRLSADAARWTPEAEAA